MILALALTPHALASDETPPALNSIAPDESPLAPPLDAPPPGDPIPDTLSPMPPPLEGDSPPPLPESASDSWPQWRGPLLNGVSPNGMPPLEWSEDKNVRWKKEIAGRGSASPIVWGNKVFVLTAINTGQVQPGTEDTRKSGPHRSPFGPGRRFRPFGAREGGRLFPTTPPVPREIHQFVVMCLDRASGNTLWQKTATQSVPHEGHHENNSFASGSPVTDGERLYASFGSRGIYCYTMDGDLLWQQKLGDMLSRRSFGEGSSPVLAGNALVLTWDHEGQSFITALDKFSGETLWRVARDEESTWSTPLPVETPDGTQIVTNGHRAVRSYDLASGDLLWETTGQSERPVASPVAGLDHVFVASGYRSSKLSAVQLGHFGDLTGTDAVSWEVDRNTPDIPSLLLSGDRLFFLARNSGMLSCLDALTGTTQFGPERIGLYEVYASPVAAAGHVFVTGREGATVVLKDSNALQVVATNILDDSFDASAAIAGNEIFLRGKIHLYCIAEGPPPGYGKTLVDPAQNELPPPPLSDLNLPPKTPATALDDNDSPPALNIEGRPIEPPPPPPAPAPPPTDQSP